jgi:AcrR family transcriptional regulator
MSSEQARPGRGKGRALRRDAARNRERLLGAAFELFAEQGPDVGVDEIARRAGVGPGTLYRRFPTKEALIEALYEIVLDEVLSTAREALGEEPGAALERCLTRSGEIMAAHRGCLARLWTAGPEMAPDRVREFRAAIGTMLDHAAEAGRVRSDLTVEDVRMCLLSLRCVVEDTVGDTPDLWRRHLDLLIAGMRPSA